MRRVLAGTVVAVAALVAASMLGVASAEAPTSGTPPVRIVAVQGVAMVPVAPEANTATADATYRQAMAAAVADGHEKAEFLAGKAGASLGVVESVVEGGGSIQCTGPESQFVEYEGAEPDFGYSSGAEISAPVPEAAGGAARKPPVKHVKKHKKKHVAKAAAAASCTLSAQVSLSYAIS